MYVPHCGAFDLNSPIHAFGVSTRKDIRYAFTQVSHLKALYRKLAERTGWCMLLLAVLPVALRLALWPFHPAPTPSGGDDFSYLLLGDTFAHFRLSNPVHPMHRFFETDFVLQEPSYSSIFAPAQGMILAIGYVVAGNAWAGVLLSGSLFCALCYWMLRGWTTPSWALTGGLLAVAQFGPLNQWTNTYYGGLVSAIAGCMIFGALPRLHTPGSRVAEIMGAGLGLQILARPFEAALIAVGVMLYLLKARTARRTVGIAALAAAPALGFLALHNHAVTGRWLKLPYVESREQYGVPTTFTFQSLPVPRRALTREQQLDYRAQSIIHGDSETVGGYFERLAARVPFYRFFFPVPLCLALVAFLWRCREPRFRWLLLAVLIVLCGTNFYPYFYPHYIAVLTSVFVLMSVAGLEQVQQWPRFRWATGAIVALCTAQFLFFYGVHLTRNPRWLIAVERYETPNFIGWGDSEGRVEIHRRLAAEPGRQLVFVRYAPTHLFREWVHNGATVDAAPTVWARDLGAAENEILRRYYAGRTAWLLQPDVYPPVLTRYHLELEPAAAPSAPEERPPELPASGFIKRKPLAPK